MLSTLQDYTTVPASLPPTPHFFKASGDIAFSTIPQGVLSICSAAGGKMLWLLGRKINSIILSVNSGSTHLALFGVKLQTNIIITSAFDVKPDKLAQYSIMTMTTSAQLLTHLLTASFLAKQPRRFFEMSFMWLWCLISESKLLTYSFKKFMVIQVE